MSAGSVREMKNVGCPSAVFLVLFYPLRRALPPGPMPRVIPRSPSSFIRCKTVKFFLLQERQKSNPYLVGL